MNFQKLISELKRRNVLRVATVYAVTGWLIIQVVAVINDPLSLPEKFDTVVIICVAVGLPIVMIVAWIFELTPKGIKKTDEVEVSEGFNDHTKRNLNRVTIAILVVALSLVIFERIFLVGSGFYDDQNPSDSIEIQEKSVVVLPFLDFSPDSGQEWFADGLTDELLNSLSRVPELRVIARTTSFALKGKELSVQKIADSLNVDYLVEGSIQKVDNRIKVIAQLINPELDDHIWSNTYEKEFVDIFDIQQDIAEGISGALNIYFDDDKREEMFSTGTRNADAYEAYLRGNELFTKAHSADQDSDLLTLLDSANTFYQEGIGLDPNFAALYYKHQDLFVHFPFHFGKDAWPEGLTENKIVDIIGRDFRNARRLAKTRGEQIFYELETATISNNWRAFPKLLAELKSDPASIKSMSRFDGLGWTCGVLIALDQEDIALKVLELQLSSDPLNRGTKFHIFNFLTAQNKLDSARAWHKREMGGSPNPFWELLHSPEKLEELLPDIQSQTEQSFGSFYADILTGKKGMDELNQIMNRVTDDRGKFFFSIFYAALGEQEKVDSIASQIDNSFLGPSKLSDYINGTAGKFPFRLSAVPNYTARLKEAGITELNAYEEDHRLRFGE
jgi:TolB-like protein